MFGKKSDAKSLGRIDSLIGVGTRIEGNVVFAGGLRIDGVVVGNVLAAEGAKSATLVLSEHATVEGAVKVAHLIMNGTITGPVVVTGSLELQAKARVVGDVEYTMVEMHQGAVIEGRLTHCPVAQGN